VLNKLSIPTNFSFSNLRQLIEKAYKAYDQEWDGKLWRSGSSSSLLSGTYYHTDFEGAEFYGVPEEHKLPNCSKIAFLDLDNPNHLEFIESLSKPLEVMGDIALVIEESLPELKKLGFDCLVISGDTGRDIWGTPVEVVKLH